MCFRHELLLNRANQCSFFALTHTGKQSIRTDETVQKSKVGHLPLYFIGLESTTKSQGTDKRNLVEGGNAGVTGCTTYVQLWIQSLTVTINKRNICLLHAHYTARISSFVNFLNFVISFFAYMIHDISCMPSVTAGHHYFPCASCSSRWAARGEFTRKYKNPSGNPFQLPLPFMRPPLWSSGQSSWLQIQRSDFDSRRYQIF
jgi:hypothetical protein